MLITESLSLPPESSTLLCFVAISEVYLGINVVLSTTLVAYLAYEGGSRRPLSRVCVATRASVSVIAVVPLSLVSCRVVSREPCFYRVNRLQLPLTGSRFLMWLVAGRR